MPQASDPLTPIRVRGLRKVFRGHLGIGKFTAVDGLDLDVRPGEIFGLLGPNGAGKTTTMKLLLGLLRPDAGELSLCGHPPSDPRSRVGVGYLPESPYFYDDLTGREFLDFYARLRGLDAATRRDIVSRAIERVGLGAAADRAMRKFSKGMLQRVGLAQAIQHDPQLVILDEPMSGLDPIGRRDVRDLILSLRDAGKTIFFSSHILQDAEMICDRVAILRGGRCVSSGALNELIDERVEWIEVSVEGPLPADLDAEMTASDGRRHLLRVESVDALRRLLDRLHASGSEVVSLSSRRSTLEALFLREVRSEERTERAAHG